MGIRIATIATIVIMLCMPLVAPAQQEEPEEVLITGKRFMLRTQLMETEKAAYDIFNKFNDEKMLPHQLQYV
jgi:hypothetical protein